ncbi:complex I NDUFA9 subunit family protein [Lutimaribacter sp. EGI FJ00015]|uniref:Complex I NDUFA9 subunit family protein n=1 Tax=Lutimaribacter degradans TaxID=2945989 RepID=A0ACC5ZV67_9RHOB|nr:complex I NDUFA9 subunit family protein [Lutimaribacter sp. EGI FJ00013]MCM2561858.1 complex I NDUFA9 subunit family protein [Lutimaribacter sp. EGI FJ00013]MCO0613110.1 complex I NDUFA9 subunit family protein [Lutimaribacter sp. EGI FJ00015]MCO0635690.1 complex I NDUFA9 subunit family protein [Lutimaribacter sp. EGI FJ00014]
MSKLVTIYGGSGFVGRYIVRRLARNGWRVRVAVRRPNEAMHVKPDGVVGQVEPVFCNIRDDNSVRSVMHGADAVVNCVGTFDAGGKNNFDAVQHEGAERIARIAAEEGVARMVHISAIGADTDGPSRYARTKAMGEEGVLQHMPGAMILRPSVVFGPEDAFFNRFARMAASLPVLPLVGAGTKFQPVYVGDVAAAATMGVEGQASGIYELGGPDVRTFRELMQEMLGVIQRRKIILNMPFWVARVMAFGLDMVQAATLGLVKNSMITRDQVKSLTVDNVVSPDAKGFADLGIQPTATEAVLHEYLWSYRPSGQYAALKNSARNLRT